jgi:hypothetical protein
MHFEVLPAFLSVGSYTYPDSNMGGNWKSTNPKAEQREMVSKNLTSNGLLFDTCKHFRIVRDSQYSSYKLSGIVIDSFVYWGMGAWKWTDSGGGSAPGEYERKLKEYLHWGLRAPGSNQSIDVAPHLEGLRKVVSYIAD